MAASIRATWLLVIVTAALLVALLASPLASTAMGQTTEDQYGDDCAGAEEVASIGPTTLDQRRAFETTGDGFLVSYNVEFVDPNDFANFFEVDIEDEFGLVEFDLQEESGSYRFFVPEDPGAYEVITNVSPNEGAEYTLTVEDCIGDVSQQPPPDDTADDDVAAGVDPSTIPDKKLPNTGGVPLTGLLLLGGVGSVVAGSLLRVTLGRSRR